jgi:hypothetical protein
MLAWSSITRFLISTLPIPHSIIIWEVLLDDLIIFFRHYAERAKDASRPNH